MSWLESGCLLLLFFLLPTGGISHNPVSRSVNAAMTATHPEAVEIYGPRMYKLDLLKFDPLAYALIAIVIALQIYSTFLRSSGADTDADAIIERSDAAYQAAVFDSSENKGILHQIFRQHEVDRDLLKATLAACSR